MIVIKRPVETVCQWASTTFAILASRLPRLHKRMAHGGSLRLSRGTAALQSSHLRLATIGKHVVLVTAVT